MCGKPKRPRIPPPEKVETPGEAEIRREQTLAAEQGEQNKLRARGLSSTIITGPGGVSLAEKNKLQKRTLLGG